VAGLEHLDRVRLQHVEKCGCVDRSVNDGLAGWVGSRLDVREEESQRMRRLGGEDREQRDEMGCLVVGEVCEDEGFGVVLVYSAGCQ
jgi:hypothetical protein